MPTAEGACPKCKRLEECWISRAVLQHSAAPPAIVQARMRRRGGRAICEELVRMGAIRCTKCQGPLEGSESLLFQRLSFEREATAIARSVLSASIAIKCRTRLDDLTDDTIGRNMGARAVELVRRAKSLYRELAWEWDD